MRGPGYYEPVVGLGLRKACLIGSGMCMPVEPIAYEDEDELVVLSPDRDLLSVDHEIVRARPDCFVPALSRSLDPETHTRMADLTGDRGRDTDLPTPTSSTSSTSGLRLPDPDDYRPLRLPT